MPKPRPLLTALALALLGATAAAAAAFDLARYEGRYETLSVSGPRPARFVGGDMLEIVATGPQAAFVRARVSFFDGEGCAFHGPGRLEGEALVVEAMGVDGGPACTVRLARERNDLTFRDDGACRRICGVRGRIDGAAFEAATRRPIRDLERVRASPEYRQAMARR